jgi:hypothetical protein
MPILRNRRHEQFANFVAGGMNATKAYVAAGFSGNGAAQSASRLSKQPSIAQRIEELRSAQMNSCALEAQARQTWLTRSYVLEGMKRTFERALCEGKLASAVQALRLLGLEVGLFSDRLDKSVEWDGDLSKLTMPQLERVLSSMQAMLAKELANGAPAEPGDQALLLPAGPQVVDVEVQP